MFRKIGYIILFVVGVGQISFHTLGGPELNKQREEERIEREVDDINCKMVREWKEDTALSVPISERRGWEPKPGECE